jgi:hypothetical protein
MNRSSIIIFACIFVSLSFFYTILVHINPVIFDELYHYEYSKVFQVLTGNQGYLNPFPIEGQSIFTILLIIVYYLITMIFGYLIFFKTLLKVETSFIGKLWASFLPGYLIIIGINRISTIVFNHNNAPIFIFILLISLVLYFSRYSIKNYSVPPVKIILMNCMVFMILMMLTLFFLITHVQLGIHFLIGDGSVYIFEYLSKIFNSVGTTSRLPIISLHYDELLFNYPLIFQLKEKIAPVIFFWILTAVGKTSLSILIYHTFRSLKISKPFSFSTTLFLFLGTVSFNPLNYILLYDNGNPFAFSFSIGRIIGALIPVLLFIKFQELFENNPYPRYDKKVSFFLLGIGFASTPIHNAAFMIFTIVFLMLFYNLNNNNKFSFDNINYLKRLRKTVFIAFLGLFITYMLSSSIVEFLSFLLPEFTISFLSYWAKTKLYGIPILIALFFGAYQVLKPWNGIIKKSFYTIILDKFIPNMKTVYFATGMVIAFIFFGNLSFKFLHKFIEVFFLPTGVEWDILKHGMGGSPLRGLNKIIYFDPGGVNMYFKSVIHFFSNFGFFIGLTIIAMSLIKNKKESLQDIKEALSLQYFIALFSLLLGVGFLVKDFLWLPIDPWFRTRLIEVPVYTLTIVSLIIIGLHGSIRLRVFVIIVMIGWSIFPYLSSSRHIQWFNNLQFLITN